MEIVAEAILFWIYLQITQHCKCDMTRNPKENSKAGKQAALG